MIDYENIYNIIQKLQKQWVNDINKKLEAEGRLPLPIRFDWLPEEWKEQCRIDIIQQLQTLFPQETIQEIIEQYPDLQLIFKQSEEGGEIWCQ